MNEKRGTLLAILLVTVLALPGSSTAADPAAGAGAISGRVTDILTGLPIPGVTVEAVNVSIETKTDADGRYRLVNVPEGERYVQFDSDRYAYEYYPDAPRMFLAQMVTVRAGEETTGIDAALAPGGRITGRATDLETGAALAGVRVRALLPDLQPWWPWRSVREAVTGADGRYAIEGLWTDVYHVDFLDEAGDHATQGFGASVGVLTGEEVTGIDAALEHEGHIAGQVTDEVTGDPLAGVTVAILALDTGGDLAATVETDADGRYEATSLRAGGYWLHFEPHDKLHAARYYGGETELAWQSRSVQVEVGRTTGGIDQQLPELAAITGRVTDATTGAGLRGVEVYLDWYNSEYRRDPETHTGPDGTYTLAKVPAGKHTVWVHDPSGKYRDEQAVGLEGDDGALIVQEGRISREVNAALTPWAISKRKITGTVTDAATGLPLGGIEAHLWYCYRDGAVTWRCPDLGVAATDAQGRYALYDPSWAAWGLRFIDPTGQYLTQDAANFRLPGEDEALVYDAALRKPEPEVYGGIAGKVTAAATGEPLAGQPIYAVYIGDDLKEYLVAWVNTVADGTYRVEGLRPGQYKVMYGWYNGMGARYVAQWHDGTVTVKANEITPGVDFALVENGRITGTVYSSLTGAPISKAWVAVCTDREHCSYATAGDDGAYVSYQSPGAYRVQVHANGHESRYYRDAVAWEQGEAVTVTQGIAAAGIDIALPHYGRITGRVTDAATGAALAGMTVKIITKDGGWYTAASGSEGRYDSPDLYSGTYRLRFEDPKQGYATLNASEPVTVTVNMTATVDGQLTSNGYISGRVTAAESGEPLGGIEIRAGSLMLWTDPDGTYRIGPLPDGEYQVRYWDPALLRRMDYSEQVTVKAGETTAGVDHAMILLAIARGRVVDADTSAPVAGVKVSGQGYWSANVPIYTDAEGRYEVKGLNEGEYTLTVRDGSHAYLGSQSAKVSFPAGTIVDMPDVKLKQWGEFGGTVTDARTGAPAAGVWVQLYSITWWGEWYTNGYAVTGPDGTYRIRGLYDWTGQPVFYDPQARFHAQSYGGGKSLLDSQTASFKRGADTLGVDAALVLNMHGQPFPFPTWTPTATPFEPEQRLYLPVLMAAADHE